MAGEILKKRREELGLDIVEIAHLLKVKADYLTAIEDDKYGELPVGVYTNGYIRMYAKHLNIDPEPVIKHYASYLSQSPHQQCNHVPVIPIAFSRKRRPVFFYLAILLVALAALSLFFYMSGERNIKELYDMIIHKAPVGESINTENISGTGRQVSTEKKEHILSIKATEVGWVYLQFDTGKSEEVFLVPGQSKTWNFSENVLLKIGNAGGVSLNLDGENLGVPGKSGEVVTLTLPAGSNE